VKCAVFAHGIPQQQIEHRAGFEFQLAVAGDEGGGAG
jgi:hypothetical protein